MAQTLQLLTNTKFSKNLSLNDLSIEQEDIIDALYERNILLIAQAGTGKTVCAQTAIQELITDSVLHRVIIFAPLKVCNLTWAKEHLMWDHLWALTIATGDEKQRIEAVMDCKNSIVVMNLDNLKWYFRTFGDKKLFDGLLIDEISKLKNPGSENFKAMRYHLKDFKCRYGMSATPVHEAATDIYAQLLVVDNGATLGRNKENFLHTYFMQMDFKGYKWDFQPGGLERLVNKLQSSVYVADTTEYEKSLPILEDVIIPVTMPLSAWEVYDDIANTQVAIVNDKLVEAPNMAIVQGKLQQICCGAIYHTDSLEWLHQEKYTQLTKLVEKWQEPVVIVYQFIYELEMLRTIYPQAIVLADDAEAAEAAWNAGKYNILLVHPKSASHGLNLQQGGYRMIWLSPVWSADQWDQTIRRLWRRGQPASTVWRYTLVIENTVERIILNRHITKNYNATTFINHLKERQRN